MRVFENTASIEVSGVPKRHANQIGAGMMGRVSRAHACAHLRAILLAGCAVLLPELACAEPTRFDIAPQDLGSALNQFAVQSGREILFAPGVTASRRTTGVKGDYEPTAALDVLLRGTGLLYRTQNGTMLIVRAEESPNPKRVGAELSPTNTTAQAASAPKSPAAHVGEEIIVTGTRIRGIAPVGSEVIVLNRRDLESSGRGTVTEILAVQPQVQTVGVRQEGQARGGGQSSNNINYGTGVNLRGLGADATLVLLNGRRLAPAGAGSFVDISQIPLAALERVEILADGASAIYGSDAIAGVVNFVTRRAYDGAETSGRFGFSDGSKEFSAAQTVGRTWSGGSALLSYEHYAQSRLAAVDRSFASSDLRSFGGPDLRITTASPGTIAANGINYAIPRGQNGRNLTASQLTPGVVNLQDDAQGMDLLPDQRRDSVFVTATQDLTSKLSIFADGIYSRRRTVTHFPGVTSILNVPATNPFFVRVTPATTAETVAYSFINDLGPLTVYNLSRAYQANAGFKYDITDGWQATAIGTQSQDVARNLATNYANSFYLAQALADPNPATAFNPFGSGDSNNPATLNRIRGYTDSFYTYRESTVGLSLSGPLLSLPAGEARLAVGAEGRREVLTTVTTSRLTSTATPVPGSASDGSTKRYVRAAYGEFVVPIVSPDFNIPGIDTLTFSAAARAESYSDFGGSANPKLGVSWKPKSDLLLRSSWSSSFKAPRLLDLREYLGNPQYSTGAVADPAASTGLSNVIFIGGSGRYLKPETSTSWSLGADWTPSFLPKLKVAATYFSISYKDRILAANTASMLADPASYPGMVTRNPSAALVAQYYNSPSFSATAVKFPTNTIAAILDARLLNVGVVEQSGIDLSANYSTEVGAGTLSFSADFTRLFKYVRQQTTQSASISFLNQIANPVRTRAHAGVAYGQDDSWTVGIAANYVGAYVNTTLSPNVSVTSWTTFDLRGECKLDLGSFGGPMQIAVNIRNLADRDPPRVANVRSKLGYDPEEASAIGRVVSLQVTKKW
jgi:iron complex outermembrane recepter protein